MSSNLEGRVAVVFGVANKRSIAWTIAQGLHAAGAELVITYQNERLEQEAKDLILSLPGAQDFMCDVSKDECWININMGCCGAEKVVPHYNVMGVAKAGLECAVRYLAYELGKRNIRGNAISAGPIKTLPARGIAGFGDMQKSHAERSPL